MDATWLDELVKPLLADPSIDVVGGRTEAWAETPREQAFASVLRPRSLTEASSRCVAFRRTAWKEVGGYPEITLTAEDTAFNDRLRKAGKTTVFSEEAIVYWRMPATWKRFCRTVYRYSKGDGICALHVEMHIMKAVKWVFFPVGLVLSLRRYGLVHAVADFARLAGFAVGVIQRCRLQLAGLRAR